MSEFYLTLAVVGLAALLVFIYRLQRRTIAEVDAARKALDAEERRMFAFLHGLGDALAKDESAERMYEIIVNGVVDVIEARGGVLYLYNSEDKELIPAHLTRGCPPVVPLPDHVITSAIERKNKNAVGSYVRLASVSPGEGFIGRVFGDREALQTADLAENADWTGSDSTFHRGHPAMAQPLVHGDSHLGVLCVVGLQDGPPFDSHDFDLFRSVAEQSAFALGNALIHKEAADKRRMEEELKAASEIQRILLPSGEPDFEGYRLVGENYPAKIVSGDYYDFVEVDDRHLGVVIADVSGKGIPASLIMAMCRSVLRANAPGNHSPAAVLSAVNRLIFPDIREDMFISMAYLLLEKGGGNVTMARAGHDAPLHFSAATGGVDPVTSPGMAVGIDGGDVFDRVTKDHTFTLASGDSLLLFTDGTHEALDADGDEFGEERLRAAYQAAAAHGAEGAVSAVMTAVREFVGDPRQSDDITLIAVEKR